MNGCFVRLIEGSKGCRIVFTAILIILGLFEKIAYADQSAPAPLPQYSLCQSVRVCLGIIITISRKQVFASLFKGTKTNHLNLLLVWIWIWRPVDISVLRATRLGSIFGSSTCHHGNRFVSAGDFSNRPRIIKIAVTINSPPIYSELARTTVG